MTTLNFISFWTFTHEKKTAERNGEKNELTTELQEPLLECTNLVFFCSPS